MLNPKTRERDSHGRFMPHYNLPIKQIVFLYKEKGISVRKIAKKFKCSKPVIKKILRKHGFKIRNHTESRQPGTVWHRSYTRRVSGKNSPGFKGTTITYNNYVSVWKPRGDKLQHRDFMEKYLKRKLKTSEWVHHIDGNKQNNKISNLTLCTRNSHSKIHASIQKIGYQLIKIGIIKFSKIKNEYYINKNIIKRK